MQLVGPVLSGYTSCMRVVPNLTRAQVQVIIVGLTERYRCHCTIKWLNPVRYMLTFGVDCGQGLTHPPY